MSPAEEADQIVRAAGGDRRAQEALVNRHMPRVHALARRMMRNDAEADDITQDAFIRAWAALPGWEPRARFSTWLHRVTLNLCYDALRMSREIPGLDGTPEQVDTALLPDQSLDQAERVAAIETAIAALPERQRAALALCSLDGHGNIDAAEIMGVSVEALESLLSRARRTLKQKLRPQEERT